MRHSIILLFFLIAGSGVAAAQQALFSVEIETRILDFDPFSGMKSRHTIEFVLGANLNQQSLRQSFQTGTTEFFGISLDSVRDKFRSEIVPFGAEHIVSIKAIGETASGVRVVPNINYEFWILYNLASGKVFSVTGCHDGYPAYEVKIRDTADPNGRIYYSFRHRPVSLVRLFGACDVEVTD